MYYDLIVSLPHLPRLDSAERMPTTRLKLRQRLQLLKPDHADQLKQAYELVQWRAPQTSVPVEQTISQRYASFMNLSLNPSLREYVEFRLRQQTLMMALRLRQAGLSFLDQNISWVAGSFVFQIRNHWNESDFRLGASHTWLNSAWEFLQTGNAIGLERLLMDVAWKQLDRYTERTMFGFEAVFVYCFKWDMLKAWLSSDPEQATVRFRKLVEEATYAECN